MTRFVVEIVEKVIYKIEGEAESAEQAENYARKLYDSGYMEGGGELESVTFEVEEKKEEGE